MLLFLVGVIAVIGILTVRHVLSRVRFNSCCSEAGGYVAHCSGSSLRNRLCCIRREDDIDRVTFNSAVNSCYNNS